ncbi:MAG: three-Cys-motif partner protein TcmP [Prevotellaceae bacterium]|jgi:three-Cys-motif partner protein|nr:three-Cys-motif partner protein TcmP [Prevotellaceae bacterium]
MAKDINKDKFPEETKLKLSIFAECFREWFPVFIHNPYIKEVYIYDFFAGSGKDEEGTFGSPLILLNEAKGADCQYCKQVIKNNKTVHFVFNEKEKLKQKKMIENIKSYMNECLSVNCKAVSCIYHYENFNQMEFKDIFQIDKFQFILKNNSCGKFILLDQYGFKQVDRDIFLQLVNAPKTDFIFFISSSFIRRFKEHPYTKQYFDTEQILFDETKPKECHRLIAQYYKNIIPSNKEYYLHHFTIQKGANYWGLIFGTNHSLGMEKFLKICWNKDELSGESNCNINNDFSKGTLFYNETGTVRKQEVESDIRSKILSGEISNNIGGLKYALKKGCLPELFTLVVKQLEAEKRITRVGNLNYSSTNIHRVEQYKINLI